jgi:hypothetical protein
MARRILHLPLFLLLALLAAPGVAAANERLSNERTLTRWAHTNLIGPIKSKPSHEARTVGKLRWNTEDGLPEVYLVLRKKIDKLERVWFQIRVPGRPNGRKGWVREENLSNLKTVRTHLTIDRGRLKATLRKRGKVIWTSRIGVGAPGTPTPGGKFWIRERLRGDGAIYGPWAFGTAAYSGLSEWPGGGVIGIHGTNQPGLIPGRPSHGCIRVPNWNIEKLVKRMPIGTPLLIK